MEKQEQAKLLANPVTVCTIDQLFTFVYRALGTEIFAATLKYSKLIIDEIQSYDPRSIATILYGLKTIQQMGGRYAIITATFPPVLKDFMEQYGLADHCLFADFTEDPDILIRHKVSIQYSEMYLEEIAKQGKTKKVLVICNTVSRAQEVYEKLRERNDSVWLLHSRFIRRDRNLLEQKIMEFSESDEAGIWVTTQIVEASLDIDFDILHTEMCTADSLLQRMGRCNRKGRRIPELSNIFVYDNKNGSGSIYEENLYQRSLEKLKKYENDYADFMDLMVAMKAQSRQKRYGIQNITGKFKTVWRNSRRSIRRNILYRKRRCAISRALRSFRIPSMKKIKNCLKK